MDPILKRLLRLLRSNFSAFVEEFYKHFKETDEFSTSSNKKFEEIFNQYKQRKHQKSQTTKKPKSKMTFYYSILEVSEDADIDQIKRAYREKLKKYHPDKFENDPQKKKIATEVTIKLNEAYQEILKIKTSKK